MAAQKGESVCDEQLTAQGFLCDGKITEKGLEALLAVVAGNGEANKFYHSLEDTKIQDEAAWINL